jgi:hypothetical protein
MTLRLMSSNEWDRPSEGFLAYLERLSQACLEHDRKELDKLLRLRASSHLPRAVLDELEYFRRARSGTLRAPLRVLRYLHQLRQLAQQPPESAQLSLELKRRSRPAPPSAATRRRRPSRRPPNA